MSTRARIGFSATNNPLSGWEIRSICVHADGYPLEVGRILSEHYRDDDKVLALIALGDLSSLGPDLDSTVPSLDAAAVSHDSLNGGWPDTDQEWEYLRWSGGWMVRRPGRPWASLTDVLQGK